MLANSRRLVIWCDLDELFWKERISRLVRRLKTRSLTTGAY